MASNVEVIRGIYEGFARGDVDAVMGVLDPNVEWTEAEGYPYAGTYVGPQAVGENVFARLGSEWDGYVAQPDDYVDGGDRIVALGRYSGTYKATGKSFEAPFAHLWEVRDGKITRFRQYTDTVLVQKALEK